MSNPLSPPSTRVLVIDDNRAIHEDMRKILEHADGPQTLALADDEALLFCDESRAATAPSRFALDSAYQGREGWKLLCQALEEGRPYALAFVDVRMPPGWDGIQTIARLWGEDPQLQTVICTAYSDCSWEEMIAQLGETDRLLILKKPFDPIEVRQLTCALAAKWRLTRQTCSKMTELERMVADRTRQLQQANAELRRSNAELAVARDQADAGRLEVTRERCHLPELLGDIRSLLGRRASDKGLQLAIEPAGPIPEMICTDPTAWERPAAAGAPGPRLPLDSLALAPPCRVLLAEDGPDNQRLLNHFLVKSGADVVIANDGQVAVELASAAATEGWPFDVILMDVQMPGLDGCSATRQLRCQGYTRPIIALAAHASPGDRQSCIESGCDDYLTKPIDRTRLVQTVQRWLAKVRGTGAASADIRPPADSAA